LLEPHVAVRLQEEALSEQPLREQALEEQPLEEQPLEEQPLQGQPLQVPEQEQQVTVPSSLRPLHSPV
jgi:hypothetical protein